MKILKENIPLYKRVYTSALFSGKYGRVFNVLTPFTHHIELEAHKYDGCKGDEISLEELKEFNDFNKVVSTIEHLYSHLMDNNDTNISKLKFNINSDTTTFILPFIKLDTSHKLTKNNLLLMIKKRYGDDTLMNLIKDIPHGVYFKSELTESGEDKVENGSKVGTWKFTAHVNIKTPSILKELYKVNGGLSYKKKKYSWNK